MTNLVIVEWLRKGDARLRLVLCDCENSLRGEMNELIPRGDHPRHRRCVPRTRLV